MKLTFIFATIFCCLFITLSGQNIDSLKLLFSHEKDELRKTEIALEIASVFDATPVKTDSILPFIKVFEEFLNSHPKHKLAPKVKYFIGSTFYHSDSAKMFSILEEVSKEAIAIQDTATFAKALMQRAAKMRVMSMTYKAIELLSGGMKYIERSNSNIGTLYKNRFSSILSSNYIKLGRFDDALRYALIAESMAMQSEDEKLLLRACFNLSTIYGNLSSEEKQLTSGVERDRYKKLAHDIMVKAFDLCKDKPMSRFKGISAYNLGVFYSLDSQYVKAKYYLNEAIRIGIALPYKELLFNAYDVFAQDYLIRQQLDSANIYINYGEKLAEELQYPFHQISAGFNRGKYFLLNSELEKARSKVLFYLKYAQEKVLKDKERSLYDLLYQIEEKTGNYKLALEYFQKKEELIKQIAGEKNIKRIELLQAQFNHEKQKIKYKS